MRIRAVSALVAAMALCGVAQAEPMNFTFSGISNLGGLISDPFGGTVDIDTATGQVLGGTIDYIGQLAFFGQQSSGSVSELQFAMPFTGVFTLFLPTSTLIGYTGSPVCSFSQTSGCQGDVSAFQEREEVIPLQTGTLLPAETPTPVPEPSAFVLCGSGILGLAAGVRKRLFR